MVSSADLRRCFYLQTLHQGNGSPYLLQDLSIGLLKNQNKQSLNF